MNTSSFSFEKRRWLLVDDDQAILSVLTNLVKRYFAADVECHSSPQAALAAFAAAPADYELVLTDFEMPGLNGMELCRRVRELAADQTVVLMTGNGLFTLAAARAEGFSGVLSKPFALGTFCQTLGALVAPAVEAPAAAPVH